LEQTRVIVGASGTGKSTLIRMIESRYAIGDPESFSPPFGRTSPDTATLTDIANAIQSVSEGQVEQWRRLWHVALLLHIYSRYHTAPEFLDMRADTEGNRNRALLALAHRRQLASFKRRMLHPYRVLSLLAPMLAESKLSLNDSIWRELEGALDEATSGLTQQHIVTLDSLDDERDNAPSIRQDAHAGLVAEVIQSNTTAMGRRFRPVVTATPAVLRRLRRSRRTSTDNVLEISWDTDSLCSFVAGQYFNADGADLSRELSSII